MQVGIAATQIAKHAGLTVIGTAGSAEGIELVKSVGRADFAFNHSDPQYLEQIKVQKQYKTATILCFIDVYFNTEKAF